MQQNHFLLYGANGYTGQLIARHARQYGLQPVLAGKKDKVNKIDIVGFLSNKGQLKKEDIGLIEVKDFFSFVAIRKSKAPNTLHLIKNEKIKNKKVKIEVAK